MNTKLTANIIMLVVEIEVLVSPLDIPSGLVILFPLGACMPLPFCLDFVVSVLEMHLLNI
jgi:hypothetical protein